jgi:hypothetical protein
MRYVRRYTWELLSFFIGTIDSELEVERISRNGERLSAEAVPEVLDVGKWATWLPALPVRLEAAC